MKTQKLETKVQTDKEVAAIETCVQALRDLTFDATWRVLNYLCVRMLGHRSWGLPRPASDTKS